MTPPLGPTAARQDGETFLLAAGAVALGVGAAPHEPTIGLFAAITALCLIVTAMAWGSARWVRRIRPSWVMGVLLAGIGLAALASLSTPAADAGVLVAGLAVTGVLGAAAVAAPSHLRGMVLLLAVIAHGLTMAWMVGATLPRSNDVYFFHQLAAEALLGGENPYALQYPNIYGFGTPLYAPEVQVGDRVSFGYPYPPLSLLLALPGYMLGGDYRFAAVIAVGLTALSAGFAVPGRLASAAAVLVLVSPLTVRLLYWGWTETFVGLAFAATAFAAVRIPRAVPVLLGLLIAVKQYVAPLLLLAAVQLHRSGVPRRSTVAVSILVAAISVLPFLAWSPGPFAFSVVWLQVLQPFRIDAASIPGLIARAGGPELPGWIAFVTGGVATGFALWRGRRSPAGFAAASAVVLLAFFLFSKQAFMNYYYFTFILLVFAVALSGRQIPREAQ